MKHAITKTITALATILCALTLTGCDSASTPNENGPGNAFFRWIPTPDGKVGCVDEDGYGISCNWDAYNKEADR